MDSAIPAKLKVKLKESEKRGKYLDIDKKTENLWNIMLTVIPIVTGALGMICDTMLVAVLYYGFSSMTTTCVSV